MAKKLVSNGFSAADVRDLTGSRSSRSETYRGSYSIDRSEALDAVWKKLVGRLSAKLLPPDSAVRDLIKRNRLPAIEIKSSLVVRQTLTLAEVCTFILALEVLPDPSAEHLRELSFLDNIYPIRNDKDLADKLKIEFVDQIRRSLIAEEASDIDVWIRLTLSAITQVSISGSVGPLCATLLRIWTTSFRFFLKGSRTVCRIGLGSTKSSRRFG
jgi:hypothetical protein